MRVRFGEFTFDDARQELLRRDVPVRVTPKVIRLLELFLECRGRIVSHVEIRDRLWPDVVVSDANLKNTVSALRSALDDHQREGRFITSVHSRGYLFTDDVVELTKLVRRAPAAWLTYRTARFPLTEGVTFVGRDGVCVVQLDDRTVSRRHATIETAGDSIVLTDLASRNGTFVDGKRIEEPVRLDGDHEITFGRAATRLSIGPDAPSTDSVWPS